MQIDDYSVGFAVAGKKRHIRAGWREAHLGGACQGEQRRQVRAHRLIIIRNQHSHHYSFTRQMAEPVFAPRQCACVNSRDAAANAFTMQGKLHNCCHGLHYKRPMLRQARRPQSLYTEC